MFKNFFVKTENLDFTLKDFKVKMQLSKPI